MKIKVIVLALLLAGFNAQAQKKPPVKLQAAATAHSVTLTWTGAITGSTTQVWRAPCSVALASGLCPTASEGTFTSLTGSTDVATGIAAYTDSTVAASTVYSYYVISDCAQPACGNNPANGTPYNGSSVPSNHIGAAVPGTPPPPTLQLGPVAVNKSGTCCVTIATTWTDTNYPSTTFMLFNQNGVLISGYRKAANFALNWKGLPAQIVTASLAVCDLQTCVFVPITPLS